jgi:hypothetical protein
MQGSFDIVTIVDGKTDCDEILSILIDISNGRRTNDLKLVNYFQEMPISYGNIALDECRGGTLTLTLHQNQTAVIAHQKQTILKSRYFPEGLSVHAIAEFVNTKRSTVTLGRFAYASVKSDRRDTVRVKVQDKIPVTIKTDSATCTGLLVDISVNGLKVKDSGLPSAPGNAELDITFPGGKVTLPGHFLRERINENGHFHVFTFNPDTHAEAVISKMINSRQIEIIHMLKNQILRG